MTQDLRDNERVPHIEVNEQGIVIRHPGYEITYCECKKPIIHSRLVEVNNCGRSKCK